MKGFVQCCWLVEYFEMLHELSEICRCLSPWANHRWLNSSQIPTWLCWGLVVPRNPWNLVLCQVTAEPGSAGADPTWHEVLVRWECTVEGRKTTFWLLGVCFEPSYLAQSVSWQAWISPPTGNSAVCFLEEGGRIVSGRERTSQMETC